MPYPSHITDPLRRRIAEEFLQHEFRKLFSSITDAAIWAKMDAEITTWFDGHCNLSSVRDFWNGFHGVTRGFKLKNLLTPLTSAHISWEYRDLALDDIYLGVKFPPLEMLPQSRNSGRTIREFFAALPQEEFQSMKKDQLTRYTYSNATDHFPIIVVEREGKLVISDGNRRAFQALLRGETHLHAAVGRSIAHPPIYNSWVATSTLFDLFDIHHISLETNPALTEHIAITLLSAIATSEAGRHELLERVFPGRTSPADTKLKERLLKDL